MQCFGVFFLSHSDGFFFLSNNKSQKLYVQFPQFMKIRLRIRVRDDCLKRFVSTEFSRLISHSP